MAGALTVTLNGRAVSVSLLELLGALQDKAPGRSRASPLAPQAGCVVRKQARSLLLSAAGPPTGSLLAPRWSPAAHRPAIRG